MTAAVETAPGERPRLLLGYRPDLDGVRAIAVFGVIADHLVRARYEAAGYVGVELFFVLSGMLITCLLLQEHAVTGRVSFRRFYARRALRLLPVLVVFVVAAVAYAALGQPPGAGQRTLRAAVAVLLYVANWYAVLGHQLGVLGHTWSLAVEEQFYLLWPPLLVAGLGLRRSRRWLAGAMAAGAVAVTLWRVFLTNHGASAPRVYVALDARADALLLGCVLGALLAWGRLAPGTRPARVLSAVGPFAFAGVAVLGLVPAARPWIFSGGWSASPPLCALAVGGAAAGLAPPFRRALSWRPLVRVGRVSYGLYLWHPLVFRMVRPTASGGVPRAGQQALRVLLAVAVAFVSYAVVERPFLRLKKRLEPRSDQVGERRGASAVDDRRDGADEAERGARDREGDAVDRP